MISICALGWRGQRRFVGGLNAAVGAVTARLNWWTKRLKSLDYYRSSNPGLSRFAFNLTGFSQGLDIALLHQRLLELGLARILVLGAFEFSAFNPTDS